MRGSDNLLLIILFIANVCASFCVSSSQINSEITAPQSIKPISTQLPSYYFVSIEFLIEQEVGRIVLPQIYKNIGIDISITPLPGKRAQHLANTGVNDGEIMRIWSYGDENSNTIRVPTPYYYLETMPFVLKNADITIHSPQDLRQYRLSKIRGVKHTNNITKGLSHVYDMSSTEDMFKLLFNGKVDVVLTNTLDGELVLSRLNLSDAVEKQTPLARLPLYHYIHKKHKSLIPKINREILRMKMSGELDQLISLAEQIIVEKNQH